MQEENKSFLSKKETLLKAVGKIVKEKRLSKGKGQTLFSYEYDISNGTFTNLEKGRRDPQLSTIWKIANAFDMKFSDFILLLEKELPQNFTLIDS